MFGIGYPEKEDGGPEGPDRRRSFGSRIVRCRARVVPQVAQGGTGRMTRA
jgi:hypothetical protein